jgi:hypothetical protein
MMMHDGLYCRKDLTKGRQVGLVWAESHCGLMDYNINLGGVRFGLKVSYVPSLNWPENSID